jgi:hypothetical protein
MRGFITGREVLQNGSTIFREFGPKCFFRCMWVLLSRKRTTFLEVAFQDQCSKRN